MPLAVVGSPVRSLGSRLQVGPPLLDALVRCPAVPARSRQIMLWVQFSHPEGSGGQVSLSSYFQQDFLSISHRQWLRNCRDAVRAGLFCRDPDDWSVYRRATLPGESRSEFVRRAQRSWAVDSRAAVGWVLALLMRAGGVASSTAAELATHTGRHVETSKYALRDLVASGLIRRYGNGRARPRYVCAVGADGDVCSSLESRIGTHREAREQPEEEIKMAVNSPITVSRKRSNLVPKEKQSGPEREAIWSRRTLYIPRPSNPNQAVPNQASPTSGLARASGRSQERPDLPGSHDVSSTIRSVGRTSGPVGFTRRSDVAALVADLLSRIRLERARIRTTPQQLAQWRKRILQLMRELDGPRPADRVYRVVRWYLDHWEDDRYIPRVDSGNSLRDKFDRLERAMVERSPELVQRRTAEEVLAESLGSQRAARFFERSVMPAARELRLTGDDAALAQALVDLRRHVEELRRESRRFDESLSDERGGPTSVVGCYVEWLATQDWDATLRVLRPDSPAFAQWRREEARLDPADRDPVTGESRWER